MLVRLQFIYVSTHCTGPRRRQDYLPVGNSVYLSYLTFWYICLPFFALSCMVTANRRGKSVSLSHYSAQYLVHFSTLSHSCFPPILKSHTYPRSCLFYSLFYSLACLLVQIHMCTPLLPSLTVVLQTHVLSTVIPPLTHSSMLPLSDSSPPSVLHSYSYTFTHTLLPLLSFICTVSLLPLTPPPSHSFTPSVSCSTCKSVWH